MLQTHSTARKNKVDSNLTNKNKMQENELNLNAEILRLQAQACLAQINRIWDLDQSQICDFFQNYRSLPLTSVSPADFIGREGVRIVKNENKIYFGEVLYRKKHGNGISLYRDGRIYEGGFFNNQKNGFGCELYANGNLYIGEYSQNKKHGKGSFYWFSLCAPACTKQSGFSIEQYHGSWWGGLPDGEGQHTKSNGDLYSGGFKNGLKHGEGVEHYANGDTYDGEYINGLAEGFGTYEWKDSSKYKGDFKQGYKNGYGVWTRNGKQEYKGHYLLDRKHGYGIYSQENGRVYKGNYFQDARSGEGQLYLDGDLIYSGLWEDGKQLQYFSAKNPVSKIVKTPLKTDKNYSIVRTDKKNSNFQNSRLMSKTSKPEFSPTKRRNYSANSTKHECFQINFKHSEGQNLSTHRGCVACRTRPPRVEYSPVRNPEQL